ncbi:MAG: PIN domain nuclease [Nitrospinae bacterium]|nr:PIN domain nuclease [Nitrospinota bacterium]
MKILKGLEKLAVDANPILSAILGGSARKVFLKSETSIPLYTTVFNFREVERYIPILSAKRGISAEGLYLALSILPLIICDENFYREKIRKARTLTGKRDPDDIHLLALALKLECPLWSNDKDFEGIEITVYKTLELIRD